MGVFCVKIFRKILPLNRENYYWRANQEYTAEHVSCFFHSNGKTHFLNNSKTANMWFHRKCWYTQDDFHFTKMHSLLTQLWFNAFLIKTSSQLRFPSRVSSVCFSPAQCLLTLLSTVFLQATINSFNVFHLSIKFACTPRIFYTHMCMSDCQQPVPEIGPWIGSFSSGFCVILRSSRASSEKKQRRTQRNPYKY